MDERWSEQKRKQDLDDLNNERAGRDVGRQRRFLHDRDPEFTDQKKKENEQRLSTLMRLLRDPVYAAAYERATSALNRAQEALDAALLSNAHQTESLEEQLGAMNDSGARLPDGRLVFRSHDGSLKDAEGHPLRSEAVPASLSIPLDAPSYEDYAATRDALTSARARSKDLAEIQTDVLDPARDRLNDQDNPLSLDELNALEQQMDDVALSIADGSVHQQFEADRPPEPTPSTEPVDVAALDLPTLR